MKRGRGRQAKRSRPEEKADAKAPDGVGRPDRLAFLLLVPIVLYLLLVLQFRLFVIDDTFITFRYADNLASGRGLSFNPDEANPVEGYTNFLWVILSALAIRTGLEPLAAVQVLSVASGVGAGVLRSRASRRLPGAGGPAGVGVSTAGGAWSGSTAASGMSRRCSARRG